MLYDLPQAQAASLPELKIIDMTKLSIDSMKRFARLADDSDCLVLIRTAITIHKGARGW